MVTWKAIQHPHYLLYNCDNNRNSDVIAAIRSSDSEIHF